VGSGTAGVQVPASHSVPRGVEHRWPAALRELGGGVGGGGPGHAGAAADRHDGTPGRGRLLEPHKRARMRALCFLAVWQWTGCNVVCVRPWRFA
jgi:hypothetical protein